MDLSAFGLTALLLDIFAVGFTLLDFAVSGVWGASVMLESAWGTWEDGREERFCWAVSWRDRGE